MKRFIQYVFVLAMLLLSLVCNGQEQRPQPTFVENELIVWLEQGVDATDFAVKSSAGITPKRMLSERLNIWLFEIVDKAEPREAKMEWLENHPDVRMVQNNHTNIHYRESIPNDPGYTQQWAPNVMQLPQAWEAFTTGGVTATGDTIVVAVVDGGADLGHDDLSFWKNTREIPYNGLDDDGNGYIDDYHGWNASTHTGTLPSDSHGTHVTGIIGAVGNNGKGVCGVNWNVKVMPVAGGSYTESVVVEAYSYVLEMRARYNETNGADGAFVVATNSSFGVDNGNPADYPIWCAMYDEMGAVGILSCVAGPNLNVNVDEVGDIPSTCPGNYLIGITNTTSSDVKYTRAGYGINNIDIGSPGTNIYSTLPDNDYASMTGTSMATPQVTGTIALMYAAVSEQMMQLCKSAPADFGLSVRQSLLDGADQLPSLNGLVASSRRLNAYGAIARILGELVTPVLTGEVVVAGETAYGNTLTVSTGLTSIPSVLDLGALSYQWRRGTSLIQGAVGPTYTLTEQDLGKWISVQVKAANCDGVVVSEKVGPVSKAQQSMPEAPELESRTGTSITLVAVDGCQYNINGGDWQDSPKFERLSPRTSFVFKQRKKETNTHFASPASPEAIFNTTSNTGVEDNTTTPFKIYPNPTQGLITVEGIGHLIVMNALGQTVKELELDGQATMELPRGGFFVQINGAIKKLVVE